MWAAAQQGGIDVINCRPCTVAAAAAADYDDIVVFLLARSINNLIADFHRPLPTE